MSSKSTILFTGDVLARLDLAKNAFRSAEPEGPNRPVIHGVIIADGGQHYTYTRVDHGCLVETVDAVVRTDTDLSDWLHEITAEQPPHPDAGTELAPCVEDALVDEPPKRPGPPQTFDHDKARRMRAEGCTPTQLASYFDVNRKTVSEVVKGVEVDRRHMIGIRYNKCAALEQIDGGCDPRDVARTFGVPVNTLKGFVARVTGEAR